MEVVQIDCSSLLGCGANHPTGESASWSNNFWGEFLDDFRETEKTESRTHGDINYVTFRMTISSGFQQSFLWQNFEKRNRDRLLRCTLWLFNSSPWYIL
jgi:hypothetical protein